MSLRFSSIARATATALSTAFLATALLAAPAPAAEGGPSVSYDASTNTLVVADGTGSTDLFTSFKGVVPGDTITQDVTVELANVEHPTRLYVRADTSQMDAAAVAALADGVSLSVDFDDVEGLVAEPQSDSPAAVFAQDENFLVAEVDKPLTTTMHLTLSVDVSVGNEVAELSTAIPWIITVEEEDDVVTPEPEPEPTPTPEPEPEPAPEQPSGGDQQPSGNGIQKPADNATNAGPVPDTGDSLPTFMPVLLGIGVALIVAAAILLRRFKRN